MHTLITLLLALALLGSGAVRADTDAPTEADEAQDLEAAVSEILSRPVDDDEYGETQRCITTAQYRQIDVLDERRVAFVGRRGQIWLNQLRNVCAGLQKRHAIELHSSGMRTCRQDSFYGVDASLSQAFMRRDGLGRPDPLGAHSARQTPRCMLGDFERISEEQLALLKEALDDDSSRRARR
jgi:hypothetical protein